MEKQVYIKIRKSLNLEHNPTAIWVHLTQDLFIISLFIFLADPSRRPWAQWILIPLVSAVMFRNFALMHDAVHGAVVKNKILSDVIGIVSGSLCMLPFDAWKRVHLEHHFWSGNIDKDPVMAMVTAIPKMPPTAQRLLTLAWRLWLPVLAVIQHFVFWLRSFQVYLRNPASPRFFISLLVPVVFWSVLIYTLPKTMSLGILLPGVLLYLLLAEIVNLPHHLQLPLATGSVRLAPWEQYKAARSCIYPKWFSRFIVLNFNYHIEHHLFPEAPWYRLPTAHAMVMAELKEKYNSDAMFHWTWTNRFKSVMAVVKAPATTNPNSTTAA